MTPWGSERDQEKAQLGSLSVMMLPSSCVFIGSVASLLVCHIWCLVQAAGTCVTLGRNPLPSVDNDIAHMFLRASCHYSDIAKCLDLLKRMEHLHVFSFDWSAHVCWHRADCLHIVVTKQLFSSLLCWLHNHLMPFSANVKKCTSTALLF